MAADTLNPRRKKRNNISTLIIVALLVVVALVLGLFVQHSVTQIRDALAEEVLQQQHDVAHLLHEYARVMIALERARSGTTHNFREVTNALSKANDQLEKMRFQYSFERLDGAATAHAFVKPVLEDVEQWMTLGIYKLPPEDPLVITLAARRMSERNDELHSIANSTDQVATTLIQEQTASLDQFRKSLLGMLALAELFWVGIMALLIRQRNLENRLRVASQKHAERISDFADLGADVFWETNDRQKLQLFSGSAMAKPATDTASVERTLPATGDNKFVSRLPVQSLLTKLPFINHELSWQSADGDERLLAVTGKPLHDEHGEFMGYRGVGRDITQRKMMETELEQINTELLEAQKKGRLQAEQALRDSEQFLRSSLDALTANVAILDKAGVVIATNRAWNFFANSSIDGSATERSGQLKKNSIGIFYLDVFKSRSDMEYEAVRHVAEDIQQVFSQHRDEFYHEFACNLLGEIQWFSLQLSTFKSNGSLFAVLVHDDVTERKRLEERDRRLRAELAHTDRLSTAGEMASGLAHELNQPLTAISHNCDALIYASGQNNLSNDALTDTLKDINEQAQRAGHIIHSMRQLVQKESVVTSSVDLNALVKDTVQLGRLEAYEQLIDVQLNLAGNLPAVDIDAVQVQQVLLNLERNAVEAIRLCNSEQRRIIISTALVDDTVRVNVEDSGPGIDPGIAKKLFTSFQTTKVHGMGMGLSISRTIIEALGGRLWVASGDPGHTVFSFTLPISRESA